jgi:hypothetical protein
MLSRLYKFAHNRSKDQNGPYKEFSGDIKSFTTHIDLYDSRIQLYIRRQGNAYNFLLWSCIQNSSSHL